MKLLIQKVNFAQLIQETGEIETIEKGLLVYVGIHKEDTYKDIEFCVNKLVNLRFMEDENKKINLSYNDKKYELMIISNFSLYADFKKGNRPSFINSASGELANDLYNKFIEMISEKIDVVKTGVFKTDMKIISENDGPLNLILDTKV